MHLHYLRLVNFMLGSRMHRLKFVQIVYHELCLKTSYIEYSGII